MFDNIIYVNCIIFHFENILNIFGTFCKINSVEKY